MFQRFSKYTPMIVMIAFGVVVLFFAIKYYSDKYDSERYDNVEPFKETILSSSKKTDGESERMVSYQVREDISIMVDSIDNREYIVVTVNHGTSGSGVAVTPLIDKDGNYITFEEVITEARITLNKDNSGAEILIDNKTGVNYLVTTYISSIDIIPLGVK